MTIASPYHVLVGAETGILKGVSVQEQKFTNLTHLTQASRDNEITAMCWARGSQTHAYVARRSQLVASYDAEQGALTEPWSIKGGAGSIRGLCTHEDRLLSCSESGFLGVWRGCELQTSLEVGKDVFTMRNSANDSRLVATGGRENELKLYDLNSLAAPIFTAKNVRNDWLNLRVPVWVTDLAFLPDSQKLVTCTGHSQVRVYDPAVKQRRPVIDMKFEDYALTCMSVRADGNAVVVANTQGNMAQLDLRKKQECCRYKGFAGALRSVQCHPTEPVLVSCGLDRFLHVHDLNSRAHLSKLYLKSRLNCLLLTDAWPRTDVTTSEEADVTMASENGYDAGSASEEEGVWGRMGEVKTRPLKRKLKHENGGVPSDEEHDDDDDSDVDDDDDSNGDDDDDDDDDDDSDGDAEDDEDDDDSCDSDRECNAKSKRFKASGQLKKKNEVVNGGVANLKQNNKLRNGHTHSQEMPNKKRKKNV